MQLKGKNISFCIGSQKDLDKISSIKSLPIFDKKILNFLETLSRCLLSSQSIRLYPDIAAFAFWIRKKGIENIANKYQSDMLRLGRGVAFHITPANIPIQFAVSLVYGMLSGNTNIVRISDKEFEEVDIICNAINNILSMKEFEKVRSYICVIRYGHDDEVTEYLSSISDVRLIWGGNNTIYNMRKFKTKPRTVELCFADRDSIAIINADKYLEARHDILAKDFYNDTYSVDQNACSSPRIIIWMGKKVEEAKSIFWNSLKTELREYDLPPLAGSEKLLQYCILAQDHNHITKIADDNKLVRVELCELFENVLNYKSNMGYFFEYTIQNLTEIVPLLRNSCQTICYYGIESEDIQELVAKSGVRGVDRIVPMGHAQEFSLIWDGYDIIGNLSRIVSHQ